MPEHYDKMGSKKPKPDKGNRYEKKKKKKKRDYINDPIVTGSREDVEMQRKMDAAYEKHKKRKL